MVAEHFPLKSRRFSIAVDILILLSSGLLLVALTGRFPFSGVYPTPFGMIKIGPKPTVWLALLALSGLARITLRHESGCLSGLLNHPTPIRLFLIALFTYTANGAQHGAVDTIPARFLPYSILKEGNFNLDEFRFLYAHGLPAYLIQSGGHMVSAYPPGPSILALPFYLLPVISGVPPESKLLVDVEKLAAAVLTALSVALIYAAIKRLEGRKTAVVLCVIYALGTSSFSISSQAMWQHGPSQLLLAASLYCLVRGLEQPKWVAISGLTLSWAVLCRPTDLFIAAPLTIYVLHTHRRQFLHFLIFVIPSILFLALYNLWYFGSAIRMGYDQGFFSGNGLGTPFFEGLSGVLFSPSRGLFVYSPILLFSLTGVFLTWRHAEPLLLKYLSIAVLLEVTLYSKWKIWWGGWTFGPRLLADITPLLTLLLIPAFRRIEPRPMLRRVFYALVGISIAIHTLGAFVAISWNPDIEGRLWSWSDGQLINSVKALLSKVTGQYYLIDIPDMEIVIDKTGYRAGEAASIILALHAGRKPIPFDGYLEILRNGKRLGFLSPQGVSAGLTPFIVSRQTPGSDDLRLVLSIPREAVPGTYQLRGLLCKAGAPPACVDGRRDRLFESQVIFTVS